MKITIPEWSSIEDLLQKIKNISKEVNKDIPLEVERKWIVDPFLINYLKRDAEHIVSSRDHLMAFQSYLSVNPEIRYRYVKLLDVEKEEEHYYLAYKTDGDLVREEYEFEITEEDAHKFGSIIRDDDQISKYNGFKCITKDYWAFQLYGGIVFEISIVDNEFAYMEIEFENEDAAKEYKFPEYIAPYIKEEVTNDSSYKMKNYWKRTRLR